MKQLSKSQTYIFLFGAFMMVVGVGGYVSAILPFMREMIAPDLMHRVASCLFALGAVCFATMQMLQRYDGNDFVLRRLRRMQLIGDWCFIFSAILMLENSFWFLLPMFRESGREGYEFYMQYIYNNWVVVLLIAVFLEVYSMHRIANIIKKS